MMKVGYDIKECFNKVVNFIIDYISKYNALPYFHEIVLEFQYNEPILTYLHDYSTFIKCYLDAHKESE